MANKTLPKSDDTLWGKIESFDLQRIQDFVKVFTGPYRLDPKVFKIFLRKIETVIAIYLNGNHKINNFGVNYCEIFGPEKNILIRLNFDSKEGWIQIRKSLLNVKDTPNFYKMGYSYYRITDFINIKENQKIPFDKLPLLIHHPMAGIRNFVKHKLGKGL